MKRIWGLILCISVMLACCVNGSVMAGEAERKIFNLMNENPVAAPERDPNALGLMSEHEENLNEIKRISGLYSVSAEIVSLSSQMNIEDYLAIESEVNQYIASVEAADSALDTKEYMHTDEYRELALSRSALNEAIDMQAPRIIKVDSIYPDRDFWVRVHVMYQTEKDREFSLQFTDHSNGSASVSKNGTIYGGSYNSDVKLNAAGCKAGDRITITVVYRGAALSGVEDCVFSGYVLTDPSAPTAAPIAVSTAAPTAEPTEEPKEKTTAEPTAVPQSIEAAPVKSVELTAGASAWSDDEVYAAISMGLVPDDLQGGYSEYISRLDFCRLAARAVEMRYGMTIMEYADQYGSNEASFTDTSDERITACAVLGIVNGYEDGTFRPHNAITREQAAAMLARCARKLGLSDKPGIFIFNDNDSISGWARGHVRYVRANEIMNGDDDNNFMPHMYYTVEQAILTFYRMYTKL